MEEHDSKASFLEEPQELKKMLIDVPKGQSPERLDHFLTRQVENATRTKVQDAIDEGRILVNGQVVKPSYKVRGQDFIEITFTRPPAPEMKPEDIPLDIIFEDEWLMVVNKPAGMVVHPAFGNWTGTLANAALHHAKSLASTSEDDIRPGIIHRLDKDTSGIIMIAKDSTVAVALSSLFSQRKVEKYYRAIVIGRFKSSTGKIETNIGRSKRNRKVMACYDVKSEEGKYAFTEYEVEWSYQHFSLVRLKLRTGRTHQLRTHLQHIGKPILGDEVYGGQPSDLSPPFSNSKAFIHNLLEIIPRQALHAYYLSFIHPCTNERISFEIDLPHDMKEAIEKIKTIPNSIL